MKTRIAIIGMGVSGLAVLLALSHLNQAAIEQLEIFAFDDQDHFGKGIPFQEDDNSALINSPIDDISFDYHDMSDFVNWMTEKGLDTSDKYVPRSLYGNYMTQRGRDLILKLPVTIIKEKVQGLDYQETTKEWNLITSESQEKFTFDKVHLCCGELPVIDPYHLEGHKDYIPNPYPIQELAKRKWEDQSVAVIGTGLAAVDVIKWLLLNTTATITAFSRSGLFPSVRSLEEQDITWQFLKDAKLRDILKNPNQFNLETFSDLLEKELLAFGFGKWQSTTEQFLRSGYQGIHLSIEHAQPFYLLQQLASRVADWLTDLWPLFSPSEKEDYQKTYHKGIVNLRNPMPGESAQTLLDGFKSGRLVLLEKVTNVNPCNTGFTLRTERQSVNVETAINATGYQLTEHNKEQAPQVLQDLFQQNLIQIDAQGGLTVVPETVHVICPKYGKMENLYAHGALVNGVIYQNNSTIKIQKMAERSILH